MPNPMLVMQRKSPGLHLFASAIIPGLGTILANRVKRGVVILSAWVASLLIYFIAFGLLFSSTVSSLPTPQCTQQAQDSVCVSPSVTAVNSFGHAFFFLPLFMLLGLGVWIFGMVDGYNSASKWNREHGIGW